MVNSSVYQSKEWINAKSKKFPKVPISYNFHAFEIIKKFPLIGEKKILFAEGTPTENEASIFRRLSKKYFYGLIYPCIINPKLDVFKKLGYSIINNYSVLINLNLSEDELWKNLEKKSSRWGVNFAKKSGLSFSLASPNELNKFYSIYSKTAKSGGFKPESKEFIKSLIDRNVSKLFLVKKDSSILAGGLILIDKLNKYSILNLTASTNNGLKFQAMPFLYWNFILYSKSQGLSYFDLGGYDREAIVGDKTYNINKFKERFGGYIAVQPIVSTSFRYIFLRKVLKILKYLNLYGR